MKLLFIDVETSPLIVHSWGLYDQNIGINQIVEPTHMLCFAAKWADSKQLIYHSVHNKEEMVKRIHSLLDEADAVCHFNGSRFDIPHCNREMLEMGLKPPSPYKQIDLLQTARRKFKFPSNKLQYLATVLGIGQKVKHEGHGLWTKCMANDPKAWAKMEKYNKADVTLLEKLYGKLLPWVKHPNVGLYEGGEQVCPSCGSTKHHKRGYAYTNVFRFQRYQCQSCGSWFRDAACAKPTFRNKFVGAN